MTDACTVVPPVTPVTDAEFHAALLTGLARCTREPGSDRALAQAMDLSTRQLRKVQNEGAMPGAKAQWDALAACPAVLDDVAALYGVALVPRGEAQDGAATLPIATLLHRVAEAEAPESAGGTSKTHAELLAMEADIRAVHRLTSAWLDTIGRIRGLRIA